MSRAILFFVETVGCRAEPIFVVTLRLAVVVVVVDGRSYESARSGRLFPYQANPGHSHPNLFSQHSTTRRQALGPFWNKPAR